MEWHKVEPINSPRIYEEIVRQIRTLISEGRLKSGDRLPPERDLAERFRVSRASVREALRSLESMGLIEIRLGEGTFVREISVDSLIEPLALVILTQREAVGELFEARRLLEPPIAGLAARRSTKEEIQEMERSELLIDDGVGGGARRFDVQSTVLNHSLHLLCFGVIGKKRYRAIPVREKIDGVSHPHRVEVV